MATPKAALSSRTMLQLWPEQVDLLIESISAGIAHTTDPDARAHQADLLEYIRGRASLAAAMRSALEASPDDAVDRVWRDVWVNYVFDGREPSLAEIKRELFEYWGLLKAMGAETP
jgi:hypothetical protein